MLGYDTRMSTDLTFITNESGQTLRNRFEDLLRGHTRFFDCLVGYGAAIYINNDVALSWNLS